jgi:hypothetical protein
MNGNWWSGFKNGKMNPVLNQIDLKHIVLKKQDLPYLAPILFEEKEMKVIY